MIAEFLSIFTKIKDKINTLIEEVSMLESIVKTDKATIKALVAVVDNIKHPKTKEGK